MSVLILALYVTLVLSKSLPAKHSGFNMLLEASGLQTGKCCVIKTKKNPSPSWPVLTVPQCCRFILQLIQAQDTLSSPMSQQALHQDAQADATAQSIPVPRPGED